MKRYATISIPVEVKKALEKAKGEEEWGNFLLKLYSEVERLKSEAAFRQLTEILSISDLEGITESSKRLREGFSLG